jgi:hypothetical protein
MLNAHLIDLDPSLSLPVSTRCSSSTNPDVIFFFRRACAVVWDAAGPRELRTAERQPEDKRETV